MIKEKYEFEKVLVLSTGHITRGDDIRLEHGKEFKGLCVDPIQYGYLIFVGASKDMAEVVCENAKEEGLSAAFCDLVRLAGMLSCKWLKLDCDGQVRKDLPHFDW